MCIIGPKVDSGKHQNVFEHLHTHFGQANGQPREKETPNTFVMLAIKTPTYLMYFLGFLTFLFADFSAFVNLHKLLLFFKSSKCSREIIIGFYSLWLQVIMILC
jgi:hypothetical protein